VGLIARSVGPIVRQSGSILGPENPSLVVERSSLFAEMLSLEPEKPSLVAEVLSLGPESLSLAAKPLRNGHLRRFGEICPRLAAKHRFALFHPPPTPDEAHSFRFWSAL
jgi:hypothetical protein